MPGYFALPLLLRRFNRADDRASALVELSLVLPLLLILTAGTIELGRWFETQMQLSEALAVGLRIASQQQDLQDGICTSTVGDCGDLSSHSHLQLKISEIVQTLKITALDTSGSHLTTSLGELPEDAYIPPNVLACGGDIVFGRLRAEMRTLFGFNLPLRIDAWWPYLYQRSLSEAELLNCT